MVTWAADSTDDLAHAPTLIVTTLFERAPRCGSTRVLAIDGPAGSGKTTLAEGVRAALVTRSVSPVVLHLDDLYDGWTGLDETLAPRVERQVLAPLATGEAARWQRYDWMAGRFASWDTFPPPAVLVLEGCGSGARPLTAYTSLLVWLEADPDERIRRGVARDGEEVLPHWLAWTDLEAAHFTAHDTRARADVHLSSD